MRGIVMLALFALLLATAPAAAQTTCTSIPECLGEAKSSSEQAAQFARETAEARAVAATATAEARLIATQDARLQITLDAAATALERTRIAPTATPWPTPTAAPSVTSTPWPTETPAPMPAITREVQPAVRPVGNVQTGAAVALGVIMAAAGGFAFAAVAKRAKVL